MSRSMCLGAPHAGRRSWLCGAAALGAGLVLQVRAQAPAHGGYRLGDRLDTSLDTLGELRPDGCRKIGWAALRPPGFDPMKDIRIQELQGLRDSDPRAIAAFERL